MPHTDLKTLAHKAQKLTSQHFGKTIKLYAPIYLSNECTNQCLYCSFNKTIDQNRKTLTTSELTKEYQTVKDLGFDQVLLLTGEDMTQAGVDYLIQAIKLAKQYFTQISLEIFPCSTTDYKRLVEAGATGLTLYQETYNQTIYEQVHPSGKKADFLWRYEAPKRALHAGFRQIGLGILLGLAPLEEDIKELTQHITSLIKNHWQAEVSIGFPRLHEAPQGFQVQHPVSDKDLIQTIFSLRVKFPEVSLVLSTRESAWLRDNLLGYGINQISAASKTNPGGYQNLVSDEQFPVGDQRNLSAVIQAIKVRGLEPVLKDWSPVFQKS